jgi:hypothetical protein
MYLESGQQAATAGRLLSRSPLYSIWMAGAYLAGDGSLTATLRIERAVTLAALAVLTGLVAARFAGLCGGFLAGAWLLNAHYLLIEPNGSHTMAGVLWMAGILCLLVWRGRGRRAVAAFVFLLSTQVRSDMWLPLAVALAGLSSRDWRDGGRRLIPVWGLSIGAGLAVITFLAHVSSGLEETRLSVGLRQSLLVTHLERAQGVRPNLWHWVEWEDLWKRTFPEIPDASTLIRTRPDLVVGHIAYQAGISPRVIMADVFRLNDPLTFAVASALWVAAIRPRGRHVARTAPRSARVPREVASDVLVCGLALLILVPPNCVIRVAARNYLQIVPPAIVALIVLANGLLDRFLWRQRVDAESSLEERSDALGAQPHSDVPS